jgi:hypothetical protein
MTNLEEILNRVGGWLTCPDCEEIDGDIVPCDRHRITEVNSGSCRTIEEARAKAAAQRIEDWIVGDDAPCPVCGVWVREGDDCPDTHYDELGAPRSVEELTEAMKIRGEQ